MLNELLIRLTDKTLNWTDLRIRKISNFEVGLFQVHKFYFPATNSINPMRRMILSRYIKMQTKKEGHMNATSKKIRWVVESDVVN